MFYKTLCTFNDHFRYSLMMFWKLIKCRVNNLYIVSLNGLFNIRNFLRTFINQKNQKMHFRIILKNRQCNFF